MYTWIGKKKSLWLWRWLWMWQQAIVGVSVSLSMCMRVNMSMSFCVSLHASRIEIHGYSCNYITPKSVTICYLIFAAFSAMVFKRLLYAVFGYVATSSPSSRMNKMKKKYCNSNSNSRSIHNSYTAPNANGKWFPVATAHQMRPFISIQTQTKCVIQIRAHTAKAKTENQSQLQLGENP